MIRWTDYWPEGARAPRIDPAVGVSFWANSWWVIDHLGAPRPRVPLSPIKINDPWKRWAEQRNAQASHAADAAKYGDFLGLSQRILGRTRMVDGAELVRAADKAHDLAVMLRKLSNEAK